MTGIAGSACCVLAELHSCCIAATLVKGCDEHRIQGLPMVMNRDFRLAAGLGNGLCVVTLAW